MNTTSVPPRKEPARRGHPKLTLDFLYSALAYSVSARKAESGAVPPFKSVVSDSRKIEEGCVFVALAGEKFDGHDFIQQAIDQGARGIVCRKTTEIAPRKDLHVFPVEDTLEAYRKLGAAWRREFSIPVVAVAGAVGKTTTKEILSAILRGRWPQVLRTQGSQNGFVGIPLTLLEIRPEHGAAVVEVGIDEIGAMEKHMPVIAATASLITAIAPEHLEKLIDLPTVAREEGVALTWVAASGGLVAVNLDDPWVRPHFATLKSGRKIGYTLAGAGAASRPSAAPNPASASASSAASSPSLSPPPPEGTLSGELSSDGKRLTVRGLGEDAAAVFEMPLPGRHNAGNLLAALAVARGLGLSRDEMERGLKTFAGAEGRSEVRLLKGETPVVCDYYNASPASMEAGFQLLADVAAPRQARRWACLGDMLELGAGEEGYHRGLAESLVRLGIENVLLYGPRMQALCNELQSRGFPGAVSHHATHEELARTLIEKARPGDAILIKGSRGMRMENVWKPLAEAWAL